MKRESPFSYIWDRVTGTYDESHYYVDGNRVPVSNRQAPGAPLEPSHGYKTLVRTPWGAEEMASVFVVHGLSGEYERYAQVYRPRSRPEVAVATFQLTG